MDTRILHFIVRLVIVVGHIYRKTSNVPPGAYSFNLPLGGSYWRGDKYVFQLLNQDARYILPQIDVQTGINFSLHFVYGNTVKYRDGWCLF